MENTHLFVQKEEHRKEDAYHSLCKDRELSGEDSSQFSEPQPKKLVKTTNSHRGIVVNIIQSTISKVCLKDLFFRHVHGLDNRMPKHMVSVDEKYLRRCLEFIHVSALKAARCSIPENFRSTSMEILSESLNTTKFIRGDACDSGQFVFECPVAAGPGSLVVSATDAAEQWRIGTVMGSKSMINILNSPLFHQFGASDSNDNLSRINLTDAKGLVCYDKDSPSGLSISSAYKLEKGTPKVQTHKGGFTSVHKRLASTSSANSTDSDLLSSASPILYHGMLQCTWKKGIPYFVFSADDLKEVYVAKLKRADPIDDKTLDYVYLLYLNKDGQKGREVPDNNSQLVGKINVSTSFSLCPNNYRIMETEFILFGNKDSCDKEIYTSSHTHRKNKGLSRKVSQVFKASPSSRHRTLSKFSGSTAIMENCPCEPDALGGANLIDTNVPPNFELAAIVAKDHLPCNQPAKGGGWGLKFLNKSGVKQTTLPSESCSRNTGDCSTSMSILIPAGFHGGPRTRNGGPSSLTERWRSGGHCDCGGWDEGCPLTVLQRRSSKAEFPSQEDMQGECKSVDLVTQGSKDFSPNLTMVNVHDGLYVIHFQQPLSALQSFSIAVAIIHTQSPSLRPNSVQEL